MTLAMITAANAETGQGKRSAKTEQNANFSLDGKRRSFPKVPNLVQYVNTSTYFGRVKIEGKIFRESLATDVFMTVKPRLGDFITKKLKERTAPPGSCAV